MIQVPFSDAKRYTFIKYLAQNWKQPVVVTAQDSNQTIQVSHEIIAQMLRDFDQNKSSVLFYYFNNKCYWLLLDTDNERLDKLYASLQPFLIPSYLGGGEIGNVPKRRRFSAGKGEMNDLGAELFPHGFYLFRSLDRDFEKIIDILVIWYQLRQRKPQRLRENRPSYFDLSHEFQAALDDQRWSDAQEALEKIKRFSLSAAENIAFMRYILWGAQEEWSRIWTHPDFSEISKLPMPRSVRSVMLSAFYHQVLKPLEQQYGTQEIFQAFNDHRAKLGALLNGRFGDTRSEVLRVFAYQSVREQNHSLFEDIISVCESTELINLLSTLEALFPQTAASQEQTVVQQQSPLEKARQAMLLSDFDSALKAALQVEENVDRVFLLMQIAIHSGDLSAETVERALRAYEQLSPDQLQTLNNRFPQCRRYLQFLENTINAQAFPSAWDSSIATLRNSVWNAICDLEIRLRKEIRARYIRHFGNNWIVSIDANMIDRWMETKENDPFSDKQSVILDYSFLTDLSKLIFRQWSLFASLFGTSQEEKNQTNAQFDILIAVRNSLAHNRFVHESALKDAYEICRRFTEKFTASSN